jgi:hypothetical protein
MDNSKVHTSKLVSSQLNDLRLKKAFHPPYSPDLAPSDFFLFGYMKDLLAKAQCPNFEEVEEKVDEILNGISKDLIIRVFHDWIERCRKLLIQMETIYEGFDFINIMFFLKMVR